MSTGLENKFKFDFDKPDFQGQFGGQNGTLSEKRNEANQSSNKGGDTAEIIEASADGLDSITNFVSLFTGKPPTTETNYTPPPPQQKKVSPYVWIGGGAVVVLLIILLISSKNGQASK
jgi:hypothetical protein